ncbi:hypothetical protein G6F37_008621 [Rhizopus arrhizus]|nr:hypothetical protein G6F38_012049 [Rhizopus arrhizus]KAG1155352.1 hypothetical protein G6F37_008621 [Rhizopus arrhizus]
MSDSFNPIFKIRANFQTVFGKGYALIDTAPEDRTVLPLSHEIDLTNQRLIYASWRGMAPHCFYCHKPGHTKGNCPRLSQQRIKTCYSCGDPSHLIRVCPKRNTATVGEKHTRYDDPLPTVPASSSSLTLGSSSTQSSPSPTPILSAVSKSVHQSDIESSISGGTINGINNDEVHFPNEPSSSRHNNVLKRKVEGDEEDTEDESEQNILNNDNAKTKKLVKLAPYLEMHA